MVCKLPSARCLSKASRDGALRENMANADISASSRGISTSSTQSSAMLAKFSCSKRKSASAQRCLRPFGAAVDIAPPDMTSATCEIVPMRDVLWHACLRKARWDVGVDTGVYRPPGIAAELPVCRICRPGASRRRGCSHDFVDDAAVMAQHEHDGNGPAGQLEHDAARAVRLHRV